MVNVEVNGKKKLLKAFVDSVGIKWELKRNFKKNGSKFLSENKYFCRYS